MTYEEVYEKFYTLMTDAEFYQKTENEAYELMKNWLHMAVGIPYIRGIFKKIELDDEGMSITYTMKNSVDEDSDKEFIINVLAQYMLISWMKPKIDTAVNLAVVVGGKEEKRLQSNYKSSIDRLDTLETNLRKLIRDYGYQYNDYLGED